METGTCLQLRRSASTRRCDPPAGRLALLNSRQPWTSRRERHATFLLNGEGFVDPSPRVWTYFRGGTQARGTSGPARSWRSMRSSKGPGILCRNLKNLIGSAAAIPPACGLSQDGSSREPWKMCQFWRMLNRQLRGRASLRTGMYHSDLGCPYTSRLQLEQKKRVCFAPSTDLSVRCG